MDCHQGESANGGIDFEKLQKRQSFASDFRPWRKVLEELASGRMPPADAPRPSTELRRSLQSGIGRELEKAAATHAGDPGVVVMRRLTSAEYRYTLLDLTGLDLPTDRLLEGDAVGGAGFSNTGIVQFVQPATIERYLDAARFVADRAIIGTGPLRFYKDAGKTGLELSAIHRILHIYRTYGFRTAAGEGGEGFGLDVYPRAFFVAWQFHHRGRLGLAGATIADIAQPERVTPRFADYIYRLMTSKQATFPTSRIIESWQALPVPQSMASDDPAEVRATCDRIAQLVHHWQNRFGANADAKEEAPVLRADLFDVRESQPFEMGVNWPTGTEVAHIDLSVESATESASEPDAIVVWRNPRLQFRIADERVEEPVALAGVVSPMSRERLQFGQHPRGGSIKSADFVTRGTQPVGFEIPIPHGATSARLFVTAVLDTDKGDDCIVRCAITQREKTDQGQFVSALLANPLHQAYATWKSGVLDFARGLPQVSQREPAPSDRDPIPQPVDPTYNNPERNAYHVQIKYHRDDAFLVENILDDATRRELDQAWADLLGSFEYHDAWLRLLSRRYGFSVEDRAMVDLDAAWVDELADEPGGYVRKLRREYQDVRRRFREAEARHIDDVVAFANAAWRRNLSSRETNELIDFYTTLRRRLSHQQSIRATLVRVLLSPAFLYRAEIPSGAAGVVALSADELASRLSYFLWSSPPDAILRQAAATGQLLKPDELVRQSQRLLKDRKARRFVMEFFGQWFGFYRFDQFRGIDTKRFPEFSVELRQDFYEEAIQFFYHIVHHDRPLDEILFADYAFLNHRLATHYGIDTDLDPDSDFRLVSDVGRFRRGGLLRLGAVLATTSAPLRTSAVKRGDWILRRTLGTAVPPPPADAGSIAADEVAADGLSLRQRLEQHRGDPICANCHSRIDALGFALENYDSLGRWRTTYRDGNRIDSSGQLSDATQIDGADGLLDYLRIEQDRFHRTLGVKLLAYALGRQEEIGDQTLIREMMHEMQTDGRLSSLVARIVASRQFRYRRRTPPVPAGPSTNGRKR